MSARNCVMITSMPYSRIPRAALLPALLLCVLVSGLEAVAAEPEPISQLIGKSVKARPITVTHLGADAAPIRIVVLGQMHGNEPAGRRVVSLLQARALPAGVQLWLISTMNPDGSALGTRRNAHKVDINRNFPNHWKTSKRRSPYYAGARAASEPETQGLITFLEAVQPTAVLSFHQAYGMVDDVYPRGRAAVKKLGALLGLRTGVVPCRGVCNGTLTGWVNNELQAIGITIELRSKVTPAGARRAASAVIGLGAWLADSVVPAPTQSPTPVPTAVPIPEPSVPALAPSESAPASPA